MTHDPALEVEFGGIICPRCYRATGNYTQGHFWARCRLTGAMAYHFCCPDDCEREGMQPPRRVLTVWPEHSVHDCPSLADCSAHTEWYESWMEMGEA